MKLSISVSAVKAKSRPVITKITSKRALEWYEENRIKGANWTFRTQDKYAYYAVLVDGEIAACVGYANAQFSSKCSFEKSTWLELLSWFGRPEEQKPFTLTGIPHRLPYITGLQVATSHQGNKYSVLLLKEMLALAKRNKKHYLFLSSKYGSKAYKIYQKFGFSEVCKSSLGRGERIMIMYFR